MPARIACLACRISTALLQLRAGTAVHFLCPAAGLAAYVSLMQGCWAHRAEERPTFSEIIGELRCGGQGQAGQRKGQAGAGKGQAEPGAG